MIMAIEPLPLFPPEHPVTITLDSNQAYALRDAITCFGLAVEGDFDKIREIYTLDVTGPEVASEYMLGMVKAAFEVHEQIDSQQVPMVKAIKEWIKKNMRDEPVMP